MSSDPEDTEDRLDPGKSSSKSPTNRHEKRPENRGFFHFVSTDEKKTTTDEVDRVVFPENPPESRRLFRPEIFCGKEGLRKKNEEKRVFPENSAENRRIFRAGGSREDEDERKEERRVLAENSGWKIGGKCQESHLWKLGGSSTWKTGENPRVFPGNSGVRRPGSSRELQLWRIGENPCGKSSWTDDGPRETSTPKSKETFLESSVNPRGNSAEDLENFRSRNSANFVEKSEVFRENFVEKSGKILGSSTEGLRNLRGNSVEDLGNFRSRNSANSSKSLESVGNSEISRENSVENSGKILGSSTEGPGNFHGIFVENSEDFRSDSLEHRENSPKGSKSLGNSPKSLEIRGNSWKTLERRRRSDSLELIFELEEDTCQEVPRKSHETLECLENSPEAVETPQEFPRGLESPVAHRKRLAEEEDCKNEGRNEDSGQSSYLSPTEGGSFDLSVHQTIVQASTAPESPSRPLETSSQDCKTLQFPSFLRKSLATTYDSPRGPEVPLNARLGQSSPLETSNQDCKSFGFPSNLQRPLDAPWRSSGASESLVRASGPSRDVQTDRGTPGTSEVPRGTARKSPEASGGDSEASRGPERPSTIGVSRKNPWKFPGASRSPSSPPGTLNACPRHPETLEDPSRSHQESLKFPRPLEVPADRSERSSELSRSQQTDWRFHGGQEPSSNRPEVLSDPLKFPGTSETSADPSKVHQDPCKFPGTSETSPDPSRSHQTSWKVPKSHEDPPKHPETSTDPSRSHQDPLKFPGTSETSPDPQRTHQTPWKFSGNSETSPDPSRSHQTPWKFPGTSETSPDPSRSHQTPWKFPRSPEFPWSLTERSPDSCRSVQSPRSPSDSTSTFTRLALAVSYAGLDRRPHDPVVRRQDPPDLWDDVGVVEYLDRRLGTGDESTEEERVEALREVLAETDIHEGDGDLSDFLFHVARTRHGKIYIRVIRTLLLNRVLCSNRVSQMTKTYNDIEAVTRLLEEKEKDLELTARIGKELLSHNQKLEGTVNALESELKDANERITQLSHELAKKTELVQILTNDAEDTGSEAGTPTGLRGINLDMLQRRISSLEDENKHLRTEFAKLMHDADDSEEQEARLVKDIAAQLASANMEVDGIADELDRQKEENRLQHEQIVSLTSKLAETELRLAQLMAEHDEVGATLVITRDNQNTLASELAEFKDRYAEVVNLLAETQEQLRKQRKRGMPTVRGGSLFPSMSAVAQPDSIASELESSLYSELSLDSGISADRIPTYKKVFETVRSASRNSYGAADPNQFPRIGSMTTSTLSAGSAGPRMSCGQIRPAASAFPSLDSTGHSDSEGSLLTDCEDYPGPQQTGVPGAPGAADLEAALRRLTPAEVLARRACLSTGTGYSYDCDAGPNSPSAFVPLGCRTPDSIMSTGSSGNLSGYSGNAWRIPEKLQIVKPLEGSQTLHHWTQLATPTLGGLLEDRPGVKTRGGRALEDLGLVTFTLSDLEEDEEYTNPGKLFQDTGSVYTFTNSTVLHPDDHTSVTPSIVGSRVASAPNSGLNSGVSTPRTLSRRNSTSTFSTTLGLAKMLNERGIKAVTPSCVATPSDERNFTPTATPCNSPDASPEASRGPSPPPEPGLALGFLSSGAELLKRTFGGEAQPKRKRKSSRAERKGLTGVRLVEKLERIGIDTIMATTVGSAVSPLALQGALYTRRSTESPMAQLTFLKGSMSSSGSQEKLSPTDEVPEVETVARGPGRRKPEGVRGRRGCQRGTRTDLGRVTPAVAPPASKESTAQSALGTISSLLFGRKGGLL